MTKVIITPGGSNNVVSIKEGQTQTFTCITDSSLPAAWIPWYIGDENVTTQATPQPPHPMLLIFLPFQLTSVKQNEMCDVI